MEGKRGVIRIVEAFIAIVLISIVVLTMVGKDSPRQDRGEQIQIIQRALLDEITRDDDLRTAILNNNEQAVYDYLNGRIPNYLNYSVEICDLDDVCGFQQFIQKDIYASERLVSANLTTYNPRKVKLFIWER